MRMSAAVALLLTAAAVHAQPWPVKPFRIIVPFPPGGNIDITGRTLAPGLTETLGQPVVVDNRGGAGGTIGTELAAKSPPDGYTLLVGSTGTLTAAPALYPKLGYDPQRDFAAIAMVSVVPIVIVIHPSLPARDFREFLAMVKARPGKVTMASAGSGSSNHLAGELFQSVTGTKLIHIPYKGSGPALVDVMGGQVDMHFDQLSSSLGFIQSGKLRAIAVTTLKRSSSLPNVPTVDESGYQGFEASTFAAILVPSATPRDIQQRLTAAMQKILRTPATRDTFARFAAEVPDVSVEEFERYLRADREKWTKVVREANIKVE
ncbi:MAG: Bug family tripartite tricarboxylate transporter substrate binding protein [Burkholderiales bacterium]